MNAATRVSKLRALFTLITGTFLLTACPDDPGPGAVTFNPPTTGDDDDGDDDGSSMTTPATTSASSADESTDDGPAGVCGDGSVDAAEDCDGADLGGQNCATLGMGTGVLACDGSCSFDTSGCAGPPGRCGDGTASPDEACDGQDFGGNTCVTLGHNGGTLACNADCTLDESGCAAATCGNGALDAGEDCDGANLDGQTCTGLGLPAGTLACSASCMFNTGGCNGAAGCGNGMCGAGEDSCSCPADCPDDPNSCSSCECGGSGGVGDLCYCDVDCLGFGDCCANACDACGLCGGNVPPEWTCSAGWYGTADGCDCGCGAADPDCPANATLASCEYCLGPCNPTGNCPGAIDPNDITQCTGGGGVPPAWVCAAAWYGTNDGCDCGCEAPDPDCPNATIAACEWCLGPCNPSEDCPGSIDPNNTITCL